MRRNFNKIFWIAAFLLSQFSSMGFAMASRPSDPSAPPPPLWVQFFPMVVMVAVFYLLLIRPQMKQKKEREQMLNSLKKGDKIVTQGGIFATVVNINTDSYEVKINEETKVKIKKSAVSEVLSSEPAIEPAVIVK